MTSELHIVYATDSGYLIPTIVAAGSALSWANSKSEMHIHILDCGLENSQWEYLSRSLRERCGFEFSLLRHHIDMSRYDGLPQWHGSLGLYARFEIPNILQDVDWCVYADGDTLFTGNPRQLRTLADDSLLILGKKDVVSEAQRSWHISRGLPWKEDERVCSGFLLMNLKKFREENVCSRLFDFVRKYKNNLINPDQDALNYVCRGRIGVLPAGWGAFPFELGALSKIWCIHYAPTKPWRPETKGYFPLSLSTRLWLDAAKKICNKSAWRLWGPVYCWASVKTVVFAVLIRILNDIPLFRGRYEGGLRLLATRRKMRQYAVPDKV